MGLLQPQITELLVIYKVSTISDSNRVVMSNGNGERQRCVMTPARAIEAVRDTYVPIIICLINKLIRRKY